MSHKVGPALLFEYGAQHGHLRYQYRQGPLVRLPVDWREERFFAG
jgi:hypothetical protein